MNRLIKQFARLRSATRGGKNTERVVIAHWDRETIDYLIVNPKSKQLAAADIGSVPRADHANPLKAMAEYFSKNSINVNRLVVLLSRPELDMITLELPPADENELPALVASAVEQQLGEAEESPRIDYCSIAQTAEDATTSGTRQVMAFALAAAELKSLQLQSEAAGFRLVAIGSRHLSPLGALRQKLLPVTGLTISVHVYSGEVELAICRGIDPVMLRSLRVNLEEPSRVAEQIWLETQRCLTLLPQSLSEMSVYWCVFTNSEAAWQVARGLEDRGLDVQPIDPFIGWELVGCQKRLDGDQTLSALTSPRADASGLPKLEHAKFDLPGTSAANTGAASEYLQNALPINMLAPKQAPKPPNPLLRWAAIGTAATVVLLVALSFMFSDLRQLEDEVAGLESQLDEAKKLAAKLQGKADQVQYVESWLSDQVDWLTELNVLSSRLPDGEVATVRRLTASTVDQTAIVDLSVQVAEQENVSQLENSIRSQKYSATSKRISQSVDAAEYPWQFETRIAFPVESPTANSYASQSAKSSTVAEPVENPEKNNASRGSAPTALSQQMISTEEQL